MKKNKIFIACDTNNISKVKEIIEKRKVVLSIKLLEEIEKKKLWKNMDLKVQVKIYHFHLYQRI